MFPKLIGTFAPQTLARRYDTDPSAAGWRRFGRLPGFTNCKPKYRRLDGLSPFVRLKLYSDEQYRRLIIVHTKSPGCMKSEKQGVSRDACKPLLHLRGGADYRIFLSNDSALPASTRVNLLPHCHSPQKDVARFIENGECNGTRYVKLPAVPGSAVRNLGLVTERRRF